MRCTTSMPSTTSPNTECRLSRCGVRPERDEELAAVRVRPRVGHREDAGLVVAQLRVELVGELVAGAAGALPERIAALDHEAVDHAVEDRGRRRTAALPSCPSPGRSTPWCPRRGRRSSRRSSATCSSNRRIGEVAFGRVEIARKRLAVTGAPSTTVAGRAVERHQLNAP